MNLIDAAKQMVEAVEKADGNEISRGFFSHEITNLRAAIEAAEKVEPVAKCADDEEGGVYYVTLSNKAPIGKLYTHHAPAPEGWQPIETAPKDGTRILIRGWGNVGVAGFENGAWYFMNDCHVRENEPTHWMAVPKPEGK